VRAELATALELQREVRGRGLAVRLVRRKDAVAERCGEALVERHGHVLGPCPLQQVPEEAGKAVQRMDRIAVAVPHVRGERVVGTEHVDGGVDQVDHSREMM
jgi:hypothetical protein